MDRVNELIEKLHHPVKTEHNYRERAVDFSKTIESFEMKVFSAPLIGCGAGLILFASVFKAPVAESPIYPGIIFGLWCFFLGVCSALTGGMFYIFNMYQWKEEQILLGNAQNMFLSIYDKFGTARSSSSHKKPNDFLPHTLNQFQKIIEYENKAKKAGKRGQRWVIFARVCIIFSASLFFIGVLIPLVLLTL